MCQLMEIPRKKTFELNRFNHKGAVARMSTTTELKLFEIPYDMTNDLAKQFESNYTVSVSRRNDKF